MKLFYIFLISLSLLIANDDNTTQVSEYELKSDYDMAKEEKESRKNDEIKLQKLIKEIDKTLLEKYGDDKEAYNKTFKNSLQSLQKNWEIYVDSYCNLYANGLSFGGSASVLHYEGCKSIELKAQIKRLEDMLDGIINN